jgi:starch phosphorylase
MQNHLPNAFTPHPKLTELPPLAMDKKAIDEDFLRYYNRTLGRDKQHCTSHYLYEALAYTVRDRLMERWKETRFAYEEVDARRTCYLSLEFLMGRALSNAMLNLGITDAVTRVLYDYGIELEEVESAEHDAGLGNGGLGRLVACFLDSCATLQLPVLGYGLRYEYGMFRQELVNGYQIEEPDHWLRDGNPWELERPEYTQRIHFGGRTEAYADENGARRVRWVNTHDVLAVPYDIPVPGFRNDTVNSLRLWKSTATDEFDLDEFNAGDYAEAVESKNNAEHITMVLYPNDASENGKELRLRQQYLLASASLKDVLRRWIRLHDNNFDGLADKHCFQLNDTHPSIAVAELMRLLVDEHGMEWDAAWNITESSFGYTNHTLLPEALECWPLPLFAHLLPRHLEIIYEINARFLKSVNEWSKGDTELMARMSIIDETGERAVRMAHLACVGSHAINGVAELHTELLRTSVLKDFYAFSPMKFSNKTNGVTPRRWIVLSNPRLAALLDETLGPKWARDLELLRGLEPLAEDADFRARWRDIKHYNKLRLTDHLRKVCDVAVDPSSLFDVQVKRIHEYKRQHLNVLHIIALYNRIRLNPDTDIPPRTFLFAGKAAPGYRLAKLIIRLVNGVAEVVNHDPLVRGRLKVLFLPNFNVSNGQRIYPAADLSEQISTAGKEASGTGNMKFSMNGALTIGTLDGANIEIRDAVGEDNFFLFGHAAEEIEALQGCGVNGASFVEQNPELQEVLQQIGSGMFSDGDHRLFQPLLDTLLNHDPFFVLADFTAYMTCQQRVSEVYKDQDAWSRMSILNTARMGWFSSDRAVREYCKDIWNVSPVSIPLNGNDGLGFLKSLQ